MRRRTTSRAAPLAAAVLAGAGLLGGCGDPSGAERTRAALEDAMPGLDFSTETSVDGFTSVLSVVVVLDHDQLDAEQLLDVVTIATRNAGRGADRLEVLAVDDRGTQSSSDNVYQDLAPLIRKLGFPQGISKPDTLACRLDECRQLLGLD